jgi:hypothetical protein
MNDDGTLTARSAILPGPGVLSKIFIKLKLIFPVKVMRTNLGMHTIIITLVIFRTLHKEAFGVKIKGPISDLEYRY